MERKYRGLDLRFFVGVLALVVDTVQQEQAFAYLIVTPGVLLVTVEAQAEASTFLLLRLVEPTYRATFDGRSSRSSFVRCGLGLGRSRP